MECLVLRVAPHEPLKVPDYLANGWSLCDPNEPVTGSNVKITLAM